MACRGVRGATTTDANTPEAILKSTRELLVLMIRQNEIDTDDIACIFFTTTEDLNAEFPALAARQLKLMHVPLMCGHEMNVPGSLEMCLRILLLWNTEKKNHQMQHVYLNKAASLRPDLQNLPPVDQEELERWIEEHIKEGPPAPFRCDRCRNT
jgi:chorismate mutase